jgi:DtxR family Mn-dependent transcriptional regulator
MKTLSSAVEDYLKAIYEIQHEEGQGRVSTSALADKLGVARASVTGMLKKLATWDPQLIVYERYRGVELSTAGEKIALEVIRHHRLVELYLTEALGFSWDEVDEEADRLEHVISEDLEDRIAAKLGHPRVDPHGSPIPDSEGNIPFREEIRLTQLETGSQAFVSRVLDDDPALLRYLDQLGLTLNSKVEVLEKAPFAGPIHVYVVATGNTHALGRQVTDRIFISERNSEHK